MKRRPIAAIVAITLAAGGLTAIAPPSPATAAGPSVVLPSTPSTPVTRETVNSRPADQASQQALTGDQPAGGAPKEGGGRPTATSLAPSSTWQVSPHTGDFTWSYPMRVPPAPGGLVPDLALSYASSAVDGRTSATNNQASWVGDGWDLSPGFVERSYGACAEDAGNDTGDLCWRSDNATASYPGGGGMLICCDGDGRWRAKGDDGSRIERLTGAGNGDDNGEHWKITTVAGTQYFFGSRPEAKSTWTVPVFGDDDKEPCHAATFDTSHCAQGWRWLLDKVVDRHGNVMTYEYEAETNAYGRNLKDAAVSYVRGGTLRRIEYGLRGGQPATGRVEFTVADRCVPGSTCTFDKKDNWPDVPLGERCDTATCKDRYAPTFWSTKRLAKVTTQIRRGDTFTDVDSWTLDQQFPDPGDGEKATLWLKSIVHTGHVGADAALPAVRFEGNRLPNRVLKIDGLAPLNRYRLTGVVSETGGVLSVKYADPDCVEGNLPAKAESNTMRCFPVRWNKKNYAERTDYFHKYVVSGVTESDRMGTFNEQVTAYEYLGGAAWHHDTSEFTKDDKRTWDEFRGFARVRIRTGKPGDPSGPIGATERRYYRGMHGDKLPSGTRTVTVSATEGPARADEDWLQGSELETVVFDGDTDRVVSKSISEPSWRGPTATRGAFKAYLVRVGATQGYTALDAGGWRTTRTEWEFDDRGLPVRTDDLGDTGTDADDRCVRTWYARNTDRWLLDKPSRTETVAVRCAATAEFPADAVSDVRTAYDGQGFGAPPTAGDATQVDEAAARPAEGPEYVTAATTKYDAYGRVLEAADALGRVTKTSYTPEEGGPATQTVVTNPLGHTVTTTLEPAWGLPTLAVDANRRRTETDYDPLGRTTAVWLANRPRATSDPSTRFEYLIRNDAPSVVSTTAVGPNGNYTTTKKVYDGLLRLRQTQEPAVGGGRLLTDTRYDSQGRVYKTTQPYFNDAPVDDILWLASDAEVPGLTVTTHDGAGRKSAEIYQAGAIEKWRTTFAYGGDRVRENPPPGGTPSTRIADARGQTVEVRQHHGSGFDATRYTYTAAGRLATATDPAGNTWRYGYDLRGRQTTVDDPDKGQVTMTYDAAGQPTASTDARGVALSTEYDVLGRRTAVKDGDTTLAAWTYDTATKGKGQLATATRYVGDAAYTRRVASYTELYHPYETSITIPEEEQTLAGTYTTFSTLNPDGSPYATTLPAIGDLPKETVHQAYDDLANPTTLSGGLSGAGTIDYVTGTEYTRYGEVARVQLGEDGSRVWLSYHYDTSTRRLVRNIVDAEVPRPMQADVNYAYDPSGNIIAITDPTAETQCFRYDQLRRLTAAWTPSTGCGADPSVDGLGGPAPYWHSYAYDAVGNRLTETQHAVAGDTTRRYAYPSEGAHQLASVTSDGPNGTAASEFGYDRAGNTTARPGQGLTWDAEGKLTRVTAGDAATEFVYDADGDRLIRRDPSGLTLYLDDQELRLDRATGKKTATRYYAQGDQTVAVRTVAGLTWLAGDHQGTARVSVDGATRKVVHRRQTPFGAPRGAAVPWVGEKGFVGGTRDATTGLTHLGAREYDPMIGRFISVDPVMDLSDAQQMHGYTYSNNSPITYADPTGLFLSKLWKGISDVATHAAPLLGVAAMFVSAATPLGIAVIAGAAIFGAINAINNCSGGGSWLDCTSDIVGAVPVVGKIAVGAAKTARIAADQMVYAQGLAKHSPRALGNVTKAHADRQIAGLATEQGRLGTTPYQWMAGGGTAGGAGVFAEKVALATGTEHYVACDLIQFERCPQEPQPAAQPLRTVPYNFVGPVTRDTVRLPPKAVPHNFVGPVTRDTVRLPAPPPPPPSTHHNYTTKDGRLCNTGSRMCAI